MPKSSSLIIRLKTTSLKRQEAVARPEAVQLTCDSRWSCRPDSIGERCHSSAGRDRDRGTVRRRRILNDMAQLADTTPLPWLMFLTHRAHPVSRRSCTDTARVCR